MLFSTFDGVVTYGEGLALAVSAGDSFDDDHALVRERPELFTTTEPGAMHVGPSYRAPSDVETTSTTPGGRRVRGRS